jgi:DNA-binding transcriptional LysR family regulator
VDIESLRTFVALAETGRFQAVADDLRITQQAVSKRIVSLEKHLGVSLLTRTTRGSRLTLDGQALLPHAERIMRAVDQAEKAVRPGSRPLRVDILNRRISPAQAVYRFHQAYPEAALDAVTLGDENSAQAAQAVLDGSLDASFRALAADDVPEGVRADRFLEVPCNSWSGRITPWPVRNMFGRPTSPITASGFRASDLERNGKDITDRWPNPSA